jgi:hypothetical protein
VVGKRGGQGRHLGRLAHRLDGGPRSSASLSSAACSGLDSSAAILVRAVWANSCISSNSDCAMTLPPWTAPA